MNKLLRVVYGSKLYGTNTPTSDTDLKVVYLPNFSDVLLGKRLASTKKRVDAMGDPITDDKAPMPDGGEETEYIPFQTFVRDFLGGQTYALEMVFNELGKPDTDIWVKELAANFLTANVSSMAGFAKKQTMDYVYRGQRLAYARRILEAIDEVARLAVGFYMISEPRLDTTVEGVALLDRMVGLTGVELGTTTNNNRVLRTMLLNGREYLETTRLDHLRAAVLKLIGSYGERSERAGEEDVDWKSLSHAVRVFQQAEELLTTGKMTFPRTNAAELLAIKQGRVDPEEVRAQLAELETRVTELQAENPLKLQTKSQLLEARFNEWLVDQLLRLYDLY